ncbi:hypothetical protein [Paenibacillus qinlingensis]|uniref:DUF4179 domain-containing protein n=1 Tax=Paenibacillus qinlingensis TaxID=1837343 RepID=A0ABU1NS95_9BACL|nr:hypothetical protein [Paenibacillus qinlingensis]MDR6549936.1 hypothetical protein [Paenibacillus qinlingensis]
MNKKIDKEWYRKMDQLNDHQSNFVMSQLDIHENEPIAAETLARIKAQTYSKLGLSQSPPVTTVESTPTSSDGEKQKLASHVKMRNRMIAVGAASVIFIAIFAMSSPVVRAQIHKVFQFLPGFATVQDSEKQLVHYVLQSPIEAPTLVGNIQIRGISIGDQYTNVTLVSAGTPSMRSFTLSNGEGTSYLIKYGSISSAGNEWIGSYYYEGSIKVTDNMRLTLDSQLPSIPIHLAKVEEADHINDLGVTDTHHEVSITALLRSTDQNTTKVTLLPQAPAGMQIKAYGLSPYDYVDKPELTTNKEEAVTYYRDPNFPNPNEFSFKRDGASSTSYHLKIPAVLATLQSPKSESFTVPIPAQGIIDVNKSIMISGYPVDITKVERVPSNASASEFGGLKIYLDMKYNAQAASSLLSFTLDYMKLKNTSGSNWRVNDQTRAMEYVVVDFPVKDTTFTFYIKEAHIIIRGPWEFQLQ